MAPTKRAAPAAKERAAKAARKSAPVRGETVKPTPAAAQEHPFTQACAEVLLLLERDASLTDDARSMMRSATPHALAPAKGDRHKFQSDFVAMFAVILQNIEVREREVAEGAKGTVVELAAAHVETAAQEEPAGEKTKAQMVAQRAAEEALLKAKTNVLVATIALETAQKACGEAASEHAARLSEKEARDKFAAEGWVSLKEGSIPGKQWREKNKLIDGMVELMKEANAEESLTLALPVAIKVKPEDRGFFAGEAIKFAEQVLLQSVADLQAKIDGHGAEVAARDAAKEAATRAREEAIAARNERENELVIAENELLAAKEAQAVLAAEAKELESRMKAATADVEATDSHLEAVMATLMRFKALDERGAAGAAAEVEAAIGEEAAAAAVAQEPAAKADAGLAPAEEPVVMEV